MTVVRYDEEIKTAGTSRQEYFIAPEILEETSSRFCQFYTEKIKYLCTTLSHILR